jgi:hypothetical protein
VSAAAPPPDENVLPSRAIQVDLIPLLSPSPVLWITAERLQELEAWTHAFDEWQKRADRSYVHGSYVSHKSYLESNEKPAPPDWLEDVCGLIPDDQQFARACGLLARYSDDPVTAKNRQAAAAALIQKEEPTRSVWWQRVHADGLWSTTQSNVAAFGLFGAHLTVPIEGRFQVFVAPGVLLVSVPGFSGHRELWPATDWGMSFRLFDVGRSTVHFNLVHAWMLGNRSNLMSGNLTLGGFSVSFKPRPH